MGEAIKICWSKGNADGAMVERDEYTFTQGGGIYLHVSGITPGRVAALARLVKTLESVAGEETAVTGAIPVLPSRESVAEHCPEQKIDEQDLPIEPVDCTCGEMAIIGRKTTGLCYVCCDICCAQTSSYATEAEAIARWNAMMAVEVNE